MNNIAPCIILAVLCSGCISTSQDKPQIATDKDSIQLEGNSSKQIEIWVKNTYNKRAASFKINITQPEIAVVRDSTKQKTSMLDMGQAASGSNTIKKVINIKSKPNSLGNLNSATDHIKLNLRAETQANLTEEQTKSTKNLTVKVQK